MFIKSVFVCRRPQASSKIKNVSTALYAVYDSHLVLCLFRRAAPECASALVCFALRWTCAEWVQLWQRSLHSVFWGAFTVTTVKWRCGFSLSSYRGGTFTVSPSVKCCRPYCYGGAPAVPSVTTQYLLTLRLQPLVGLTLGLQYLMIWAQSVNVCDPMESKSNIMTLFLRSEPMTSAVPQLRSNLKHTLYYLTISISAPLPPHNWFYMKNLTSLLRLPSLLLLLLTTRKRLGRTLIFMVPSAPQEKMWSAGPTSICMTPVPRFLNSDWRACSLGKV